MISKYINITIMEINSNTLNISGSTQYNPTPKVGSIQSKVLSFIESYIEKNGSSPTLKEIRDFIGVKALSTVHHHLSELEKKGYIEKDRNGKGLDLILKVGKWAGSIIAVPLVGQIAAGRPIEAIESWGETVNVPSEFVQGRRNIFALRVKGDSMIDEFINDGDIVICEKMDDAIDGDTVVGLVDGNSATLKKYYRRKTYIELVPANPKYKSFKIKDENFRVQGRLIYVLRKY
jgi:repressor LexA